MKLLALTRYTRKGPSSRYRFYNYRKLFGEEGVTMEIDPFFPDAYLDHRGIRKRFPAVLLAYGRRLGRVLELLRNPGRYDLVLVEYELFPWWPALFERLFRLRGVRYVVDYDDAVFHRYDRHRSVIVRRLLGDKIASVMRNARGVVVCNPYLEAYARRVNRKILRLPTVPPTERYRNECVPRREREQTFVIGWIGSKSTSPYLLEFLPAYRRFAERHRGASLHLVGFDEELLSAEERERYRIRTIPWSEEGELEAIRNFDVGIMPLPDTPWSRGKCGFKLLQYHACGKGVIASPVGINRSIVRHGHNGLLAETEREWEEALERFRSDEAFRRAAGEAGRRQMDEKYDHRQTGRRYLRMLRQWADTEKNGEG
jgi:glycosyltransferase involved in cell wall biosynthesis